MGNSNSTLSVNDFKNQLLGAVTLSLIPKLDYKVQFDGNSTSTNLPKPDGDPKLAFLKYYGNNTDQDIAIERYYMERVLSNPDNLKLLYRALTDSLFNVKVFRGFSEGNNDNINLVGGTSVTTDNNDVPVKSLKLKLPSGQSSVEDEQSTSKLSIPPLPLPLPLPKDKSKVLRFKPDLPKPPLHPKNSKLATENDDNVVLPVQEASVSSNDFQTSKLYSSKTQTKEELVAERRRELKLHEQKSKQKMLDKEQERKDLLYREQEQRLKQQELELKLEREKQSRLEEEKRKKELEIELERTKHKQELELERKKRETDSEHENRKKELEKLIDEKFKTLPRTVESLRISNADNVVQKPRSIESQRSNRNVETEPVPVSVLEPEPVKVQKLRSTESQHSQHSKHSKHSKHSEHPSHPTRNNVELIPDEARVSVKDQVPTQTELTTQRSTRTSVKKSSLEESNSTPLQDPSRDLQFSNAELKVKEEKEERVEKIDNQSIRNEDFENIRKTSRPAVVKSNKSDDSSLNRNKTQNTGRGKITTVSELQDRIQHLKKKDIMKNQDDNETVDGTYEQQSFDE